MIVSGGFDFLKRFADFFTAFCTGYDTELLKHQIRHHGRACIHFQNLKQQVYQQVGRVVDACDGTELVHYAGECGAVVRGANGRHAENPIRFTALEQAGNDLAGRFSLRFIAVGKKRREHANGFSAEAVADQMNFDTLTVACFLSPVRHKRRIVRAAESGVTVGFGVRFAIVHRGTGQLRIQLACTVPCT